MQRNLLFISLCYLLFACQEDQPKTTSRDQQISNLQDQNLTQDQNSAQDQNPAQDQTVQDQNLANCNPTVFFQSGTQAFEEKTTAVGLMGVEGTLMSVVDLNQDNWPDLVVRRGGVNAHAVDSPTQNTWVLINRNGRFENITQESNFLATRGNYPIPVTRPNWVVTFGDIDNDGDFDAYSGIDMRNPPSVMGPNGNFLVDQESSEVLLNDGQGHFELTYIQDPVRRARQGDVPSGASFVDFNRDGLLDLWMSQGGLGAPLQDRLFKNVGRGDFEDWTSNAGLITSEWDDLAKLNEGKAHTTAWSAASCDLNGDGYAELLAASYGRAPNHLWKAVPSQDGVSFENISVASGYAFDQNQDWTGDQFARCFCENQRNAEGCADVPQSALACDPMNNNWDHQIGREPFRLGGNSGATLCEDWDNDGDLDLYTTEIHHWWGGDGSDHSEVLINDGNATFTRPGRMALGMEIPQSTPDWDEGHITAASIDFDSDGYQDIYLGATDYPGNRGRLYHNLTAQNQGIPLFEELSVTDAFEHNRSHGVAIADFDRDGDSDMIVGHSLMRCSGEENPCYQSAQIRYFENKIGQSGNWLQLKLQGKVPQSNFFAIGAKVVIKAGALYVVKHLQGGYGHFGQQQETLIQVGLGEFCEAEVEIHWPDQQKTVQKMKLTGNHRYLIEQNQEAQMIDQMKSDQMKSDQMKNFMGNQDHD